MARVIVHVDLDAFYAAVEQVRLGLPLDQPLAVQQWEGLIAVNYAARAKGVTRFMAINEAKQKCPDLRLVHVEVIGGSSKREEGKVSLERYRQASANILPIFHRFSPLCEKASIDEAYLDLTAQVEALLNQSPEPETAPVYDNLETANASEKSEPISMASVQSRPDVIVLDGPLDPSNEYDRRLLAGATIVAQMREAVFHELGYTCSAGIAPNKLLAKLASAMNKPYKQTVVTPRSIPRLMKDFPMRKIRNLGGKMGKELCDTLGCETAGDVQKIPEAVLIEKLGDKMGPWVFRAVRGIHDEPVQTRQISKSMLAAKSYSLTNSIEDVRHWLRLLSMELAARIEYDVKLNKRRPKTFHLYYRGFDSRRRIQEHSKSCPVPPHILQLILQIHAGKTPKSPAKCRGGGLPPASDPPQISSGPPPQYSSDRAALGGEVGVSEPDPRDAEEAPSARKGSGETFPETFVNSGVGGVLEQMGVSGPRMSPLSERLVEHPNGKGTVEGKSELTNGSFAQEPVAEAPLVSSEGGPAHDVEAGEQLERALYAGPEVVGADLEHLVETSEQLERRLPESEWADGGQSIADGIGAALASGEHAGPLAEALYSFGLSIFERAEHNMPSMRVAVAAGDFVDLPVKGAHSITSFFQAGGARGGAFLGGAERENGKGGERGNEGAKRLGGGKPKSGIARFFGQKTPVGGHVAGQPGAGSAHGTSQGAAIEPEESARGKELFGAEERRLESSELAEARPQTVGERSPNEEGTHDGVRDFVGDQVAQLTGNRSPEPASREEVASLGLEFQQDRGEVEGHRSEVGGKRTESQEGAGPRVSNRVVSAYAPEVLTAFKSSEIDQRTANVAGTIGQDRTKLDTGALCPDLSDVDVRQQQRLMAEFERQKRLVGLVKKRESEGGSRGGASQSKKGGQKRKGRSQEGSEGQQRISSFLKH